MRKCEFQSQHHYVFPAYWNIEIGPIIVISAVCSSKTVVYYSDSDFSTPFSLVFNVTKYSNIKFNHVVLYEIKFSNIHLCHLKEYRENESLLFSAQIR